MNITAVKAMLNNPRTVDRLRKAIYNTHKLGYSCDHVKNSKKKTFLAVRVRDHKLQITTRKGIDITQLIVKVVQDLKTNKGIQL